MDSGTNLIKRLVTVVVFAIAFAYIEATVVVYLRAIFYTEGFTFPIADLREMTGFGRFMLTEVGREVATLVLMFTAALLIAESFRKRLAYVMIIFAVWDIFYYVWLKVQLDWPASIMDWDVLFLMPAVWAGPVLAPIVTSLTMCLIAAVLLSDRNVKLTLPSKIGFIISILMIVLSFCIAGRGISQPDYKSLFSWPIFCAWHALIIVLFIRCIVGKHAEPKV